MAIQLIRVKRFQLPRTQVVAIAAPFSQMPRLRQSGTKFMFPEKISGYVFGNEDFFQRDILLFADHKIGLANITHDDQGFGLLISHWQAMFMRDPGYFTPEITEWFEQQAKLPPAICFERYEAFKALPVHKVSATKAELLQPHQEVFFANRHQRAIFKPSGDIIVTEDDQLLFITDDYRIVDEKELIASVNRAYQPDPVTA